MGQRYTVCEPEAQDNSQWPKGYKGTIIAFAGFVLVTTVLLVLQQALARSSPGVVLAFGQSAGAPSAPDEVVDADLPDYLRFSDKAEVLGASEEHGIYEFFSDEGAAAMEESLRSYLEERGWRVVNGSGSGSTGTAGSDARGERLSAEETGSRDGGSYGFFAAFPPTQTMASEETPDAACEVSMLFVQWEEYDDGGVMLVQSGAAS